MNIITFDYTKTDGKTSKRVVLLSAEPTHLYAGTDISSLEQADQAMYIEAVQKAKDAYLEALKAINDEFDMNFNFRQFTPSKMHGIVQEKY